MDDHHRHSFSFSNKLQGENLWSRRDTLACQQDNEDGEQYRINNINNKKCSPDNLSSPSSTYSFHHHQHEEDDGSFIHLQSIQQHHRQDNGKKSNESSIEEDQRHYNAMTSQFRMPSH